MAGTVKPEPQPVVSVPAGSEWTCTVCGAVIAANYSLRHRDWHATAGWVQDTAVQAWSPAEWNEAMNPFKSGRARTGASGAAWRNLRAPQHERGRQHHPARSFP